MNTLQKIAFFLLMLAVTFLVLSVNDLNKRMTGLEVRQEKFNQYLSERLGLQGAQKP